MGSGHELLTLLLLWGCAPSAAEPAQVAAPLAHGEHGRDSLRRDPKGCGNPGVVCDLDTTCWEGICVPSGAATPAVSVARADAPLGRWIERPPRGGGGRLDGITLTRIRPDETRSVFVGSTGGGVWRAFADGFPDWVPASSGLDDWNVVHVERDLADPDRFWAVGWNRLFVRRGDGDWMPLAGAAFSRPYPTFSGNAAIYQPSHPRPFAQTLLPNGDHYVLWSSPCSGLLVSHNDGPFQRIRIHEDLDHLDNCLSNIVVDRVSHSVFVATMHPAWEPAAPTDPLRGEPAHVYRSANPLGAGPLEPFELANAGLPIRRIVHAMVSFSTPESGPDHLLVAQQGPGLEAASVTRDGQQWTRAEEAGLVNTQPDELIFRGSGSDVVVGARFPQSTTDPFSDPWTEFHDPRQWNVDTRGLYVDQEVEPPALWAGNDPGQVGRWDWPAGSPPNNQRVIDPDALNVYQLYFGAIVPTASGRRLIVGPQDIAPRCFDDPIGVDVVDFPVRESSGRQIYGDATSFALAGDARHAYLKNADGVFVSDNAGAATCLDVTWEPTEPLPRTGDAGRIRAFGWRSELAVHPRNWRQVYVLHALGVSTSRHAGARGWEFLPNPATASGTALGSALYVDRYGALYLGTERTGVFRSRTGGRSWEHWALPESDGPAAVLSITASNELRSTFWFATTDGLHRRLADGRTEKVLGPEPGPFGSRDFVVSDVAVDPRCPSRVYAGMGFAGLRSRHRGGVLLSTDRGASWRSLSIGEDVHESPVTDVDLDPSDSRLLYVATYGRGAWVYDWGEALPPCE